MPRCHGVRIAEAKRSRHRCQEQRALRICLSRLTSFGGARACVFTLSTTTPLDGTMQTASAAVKLVSNAPRAKGRPKKIALCLENVDQTLCGPKIPLANSRQSYATGFLKLWRNVADRIHAESPGKFAPVLPHGIGRSDAERDFQRVVDFGRNDYRCHSPTKLFPQIKRPTFL